MSSDHWIAETLKNLKVLRRETEDLAREIETEEREDRKLLLQILHAHKETQQMIVGISTMLGMRRR